MRGPKVVQHEIDTVEKGFRVSEKLHYSINRLLGVDALDSYRQIMLFRHAHRDRINKLLREKKRSIRYRR